MEEGGREGGGGWGKVGGDWPATQQSDTAVDVQIVVLADVTYTHDLP